MDALEKEVRDRFGPPPPPLERLLKIARFRVLAAERGIHVLEVKDDKLMLTRDGDYVMIGSRFPRLTQSGPSERLEGNREVPSRSLTVPRLARRCPSNRIRTVLQACLHVRAGVEVNGLADALVIDLAGHRIAAFGAGPEPRAIRYSTPAPK